MMAGGLYGSVGADISFDIKVRDAIMRYDKCVRVLRHLTERRYLTDPGNYVFGQVSNPNPNHNLKHRPNPNP